MKIIEWNICDDLGQFLTDNELLGEGAEIGCANGLFSRIVLKSWNGKRYHMVDPWRMLPEGEYLESTNHTAPWDKWYEECVKLSLKYSIVNLIRKTSVLGSKEIEDGQLDWCFIDAAHDYKHVLEDMDAWFPKVKSGGLFCGHDFYNDKSGGSFCEVESAVLRWSSEHRIPVIVTACSSWWIVKP